MDAHLTLKEHHNQGIKKVREEDTRLHIRMRMHGVVPDLLRTVQIAYVQAAALYGSELWWDPKETGSQEDSQLLPNLQARSTLGALPMTPPGVLIRDSQFTPAPVAINSRQQRVTARLTSACQ